MSSRLSIPAAPFNRWLAAACLFMLVVAIAIHVPGHITVDTTIHLEEARLGRNIGWSPPMMSALLYYFGGGQVATSLFVALNATAYYFAVWFLSRSLGERASLVRVFCVALGVLSPVSFAYVGIVWKDVLLASGVVTALVAIESVRQAGDLRSRIAWVAAGLLVIAALPYIRQQGVLMAPFMFVALAVAILVRVDRALRLRTAGMLLGGQILAVLLVRLLVQSAFVIVPGSQSVDTGMKSIEIYDLAGIEARVDKGPFWRLTTPPVIEEIERQYGGDRIDRLSGPAISQAFSGLSPEELRSHWLSAIREHPAAYAAHRTDVFAWLLDLRGIDKCLPIALGVDGIPEYMQANGLVQGMQARDHLLWKSLSPLFKTPIWRNWTYLVILGIGTLLLFARVKRDRLVFLSVFAACYVFAFAYLVISIACDFRYLYTLVPMSFLLLVLLLREIDIARSIDSEGSAHD